MRIVFMGTPDFAVPALELLAEQHSVLGVFTKIDKPNQRGKKIQYSPVKQKALELGLPVFQPNSVKDSSILQQLKDLAPDLIVVVAYGKILSKEILDLPKYGVINLHSSLLPKFRGAAPIHAALIAGEEKTGVSVMKVVEDLDAGPVLLQGETAIFEEDNCESLHDRLRDLGKDLLEKALFLIEKGEESYQEQEEKLVSFVKPFQKEDCRIDWSKTSREIFNFVRGMDPFPGAFTLYQGKQLKVARVEVYSEKIPNGVPGLILDFVKGKGALVATGDGAVLLQKVKAENKKWISGVDLINGNIVAKGESFT